MEKRGGEGRKEEREGGRGRGERKGRKETFRELWDGILRDTKEFLSILLVAWWLCTKMSIFFFLDLHT